MTCTLPGGSAINEAMAEQYLRKPRRVTPPARRASATVTGLFMDPPVDPGGFPETLNFPRQPADERTGQFPQ
jgi:hypothetical protein